jgi:hypothetical protein
MARNGVRMGGVGVGLPFYSREEREIYIS